MKSANQAVRRPPVTTPVVRAPLQLRVPLDPEWRCLVVLPTFNERENLWDMVRAIRQQLVADVLIVDDASPDGTGALADELAKRPEVFAMHRPAKLGLGTAYVDGFRWGLQRGYQRLIQMDCDFSHDPHDLPRIVEASAGADLVIGSRYVAGGSTRGWTLRRRLLSKCANLYTRLFLGAKVRDWTAGYRCFSSGALRRVDLGRVEANGFAFQIQMAYLVCRTGGAVREVPVRFVDRELGASKMSGGIALEALHLVPRLRMRDIRAS